MKRTLLSLNCNTAALSVLLCLYMLTAACTSDSFVGAGEGYVPDASQQIPVKVLVGVPDSLKTKGMGEIDFSQGNGFTGKNIYIYAFRDGDDTDFSVSSDKDSDVCLVDGSKDSTGFSGGKQAVLSDYTYSASWTGSHKPVYPMGDKKDVPYEFFAYYIDSLSLSNDDIHRSRDSIVLDVNIDGRMDLMTARSVCTETDADSLPAYSYSTARKGINPVFTFSHRLVKLVFRIQPSKTAPAVSKTVWMQSLTVMSFTGGTMKVAYKDSTDNPEIVWDSSSLDSLWLTEKDGSRLSPDDYSVNLPVTGEVTPQTVGGSLLVAPSEAYRAYVNLKEHNMDWDEDYSASNEIDLQYDGGFLPGCSYLISLNISGYRNVETTVTIIPWKLGGDINIFDYDKPAE